MIVYQHMSVSVADYRHCVIWFTFCNVSGQALNHFFSLTRAPLARVREKGMLAGAIDLCNRHGAGAKQCAHCTTCHAPMHFFGPTFGREDWNYVKVAGACEVGAQILYCVQVQRRHSQSPRQCDVPALRQADAQLPAP